MHRRHAWATRRRAGVVRLDLTALGRAPVPRHGVAVVAHLSFAIDESITAERRYVAARVPAPGATPGVARARAAASHDDDAARRSAAIPTRGSGASAAVSTATRTELRVRRST
jgi:hypothetical protein